jgi:hypothetical protein
VTSERSGLRRHPDWQTPKAEEWRLRHVAGAGGAPVEVDRRLPDTLRAWYDQGSQSSCVGQSLSQLSSLNNSFERFDPNWLWNKAKVADPWPDTNPGDNNGTSVITAVDILRTKGHKRPGDLRARRKWGVERWRWVMSTEEIRTSIAAGRPVVIATAFYAGMMGWGRPTNPDGTKTAGASLAEERQYMYDHAYVIEAWSDSRQAMRTPNSYGTDQPRVWLPRTLIDEIIQHPSLYYEGITAWDR